MSSTLSEPAEGPPDPAPARREPTAYLRPWGITRLLAVIAAVIVTFSILGQVLRWATGHDWALGFVPVFNLGREGNIATFFSALILLLAAGLLGIIGWRERNAGGRLARYWLGLALLFTYMSLDETAMLHERTIEPVRDLLGVGGILYFAWVIPASILVVLVVVILIPFLRRIPRQTFKLFLLSGVLFVGGAIGVELLGARYWVGYGGESPIWSVLTTIEESMEIAGVLVFIHALLLYLADHHPDLWIHLGEDATSARRPGTGSLSGL